MSRTNCLLGASENRDDEPTTHTPVEYWYGVESSAEYSRQLAYGLESKISKVAQSSISWCYQLGNRRMQEHGETSFVDETGRRLAIMSLSSGPVDQPYSSARSM